MSGAPGVGAAAALLPVLAEAAAKGTVLLAAAAFLCLLLRRSGPTVRHVVWAAALSGALLLPVATQLLPPLPVLPAAVGIDRPPAGPQSPPRAPDPTPRGPAAPPAPAEQGTRGTIPLAAWIVCVWAAGALLVLARVAGAVAATMALARASRRVRDPRWHALAQEVADDLGIGRPLTLATGDRLTVPVTWGIVYPVVLLPPQAAEWDETRGRMVLLHEGAHVTRLDRVWQLVAQLAVALHWFNPLVWWAAARLERESELACDERVLAAGVRPSAYAGVLLEVAASLQGRRQPLLHPLSLANGAFFAERIAAIVERRPPPRPAAAAGRAAVGVLAVATTLAAADARPGEAPPAAGPLRSPGAAGVRNPALETVWTGRMEAGSWLRIRSYRGNIQVRTSPSPFATVAARREPGGDPPAVSFATLAGAGGVTVCARWSLTRRCDAGAYEADAPARVDGPRAEPVVDIVVTVPEGVHVLASLHRGDISLAGRLGAADAATGNGAIRVDGIQGPLAAVSENGAVTVLRAAARVDARSGNGHVRVETRRGPVNASTGNGTIQVAIAEGADGEPMHFSTGSGNVRLTLPPAFSGAVDAQGVAGAVRSAFPLLRRGSRRVYSVGSGAGPAISAATPNGELVLEAGS